MDYKILIIGKSCVGKTTWLNKIVTGHFQEDYIPSVKENNFLIDYNDYHFTCIDIPSSMIDTIDQKQHMDAVGIFMMCDINGIDLPDIEKWIIKLNNINEYKNINIVLVANKLDLEQNDVDFDDFCKKNNIGPSSPITVKDNYNIHEPFDNMINLIQTKNKFGNQNELVKFINTLIQIIDKCDNNLYKFKVGYVTLLYNYEYTDNKVKNIIIALNELIIKTHNVDDILNYIINVNDFF